MIADACGGNAGFATAVETELAKIDPAFAIQLQTPLPADSALFSAADGKPIAVEFRAFGLTTLGPLAKSYQIRGLFRDGKLAVIYSPHDLSVGLVGQSVDGIIGYTPDVATSLMRRLIELKSDGKI